MGLLWGGEGVGSMYALVRLTLSSDEILEISDADFRDLKNSREILTNALHIEANFCAVCESYKLIEINYFKTSLDAMIYNWPTNEDFYRTKYEYNALMIAALATVRLYTISIENHAAKIIGKELATKKIKEIKEKKLKTVFEYRAMEAIRNLSQHSGFPVHNFSIGSEWIGDKNLASTEYFFCADEVSGGRKFEKEIIDEIKERGGRINLRDCFRVYFNALCELHTEVRDLISESVQRAEGSRKEMGRRWQSQFDDKSLVGVVACKMESNLLDKSIMPVYLEAFGDKNREHLKMKMSSFAHMDKRAIKL
ncbi:hypothetical protein [Methylobacterium brachythecii]|uniref:Uncharacterized protein n=1 Tax=Methylobacterium brachythecii TaxID=1176177 RepID=A0A7W6ALT8_9HYPH|nr:hypothetical protein [Methylobacterium brachythecii]MBB3903554.1 hypothetical protein [Methylobacterium brachythecii]GLS44094.1 hypothetical protein GCM10007884_20810 [Methylobacterium brachythecii]